MLELYYNKNIFNGFEWWPVSKANTPPDTMQFWKDLLISSPPIGRGKRWMNVATPNGMITDKNGFLVNFLPEDDWVDGYRGAWALSFDPMLQTYVRYVDSVANRAYDVANCISVFALIRPNDTNDVMIASKRAGTYSWEFRINADPNNQLEATINADANIVTSVNAIPENEWSMVGFTYDRKLIRLYVNGRLVASTNYAAAINVSGDNICLGTSMAGGPRWYDGLMGCFYLWGRKLDEQEMYRLAWNPYCFNQFNIKAESPLRGIARHLYPINWQMNVKMDGGGLTRAGLPAPTLNFNAKREYPINWMMNVKMDGGDLTRHWPLTGRVWGHTTSPYNSNARGLMKRLDEKKKVFP
jgi:hypothetical protein